MAGRLAFLLLLVTASPLSAQLTPWEAEGGRVVIHFLDGALEQAGLTLLDLEETVVPGDAMEEELEGDLIGFRILPESDLKALRTEEGTFQPYGVLGGSIEVAGGFFLADAATGRGMDFHNFAVRPRVVRNDGPAGEPDPDYFFLTPKHDEYFDAFKLCYVKVYFVDGQGYQPPGEGGDEDGASFSDHQLPDQLRVKAWDLVVTPQLAKALERPDLEGRILGYGKVEADVAEYTGYWEHPDGQNIFTPYNGRPGTASLSGSAGTFIDVRLGILSGINQVGHVGTFPNGRTGLSMATTSCNDGTEDVVWLAAMQEDHPGIVMALFRESNGRFEQVGVSWVKHGFFALSNSQCTPCQNPSNGTFLGIGCSDTYASSNNADRFWLGPRDEWDAWKGTWTCLGSYFDGTPADCNRSQTGSGLGPVNHRLEAFDADLGNAGANYVYEANYLVRDDANLANNIGSRECLMSWNGVAWDFSSQGQLIEGPALLNRWGDVRTLAGLNPEDGNVVLSSKVVESSPGVYRYEYALYNWNLDRKVSSISFPNTGNTAGHYFHDTDDNPSNDWVVTTDNNRLTWTYDGTVVTGHKVAGALEFGTLYNFGFTSGYPPATRNATLGIYESGLGGDLLAAEILSPNTLELTASRLSPTEGENLTVEMRGGTDLGLAVILTVNGNPIPPSFIGGLNPFVGGVASFQVTIPPATSGVEVGLIAGDVDASLNVHQLSNVMDLKVQ
ncbi:MAG: hypothetical protein P8N09_01985 [Planctomycetota bacterium]|jgi:hypothetical protein|nr:hypothetical protein [Planctomycetota bacterium]